MSKLCDISGFTPSLMQSFSHISSQKKFWTLVLVICRGTFSSSRSSKPVAKKWGKFKRTPLQSGMSTEDRALEIPENGDFVRIHYICMNVFRYVKVILSILILTGIGRSILTNQCSTAWTCCIKIINEASNAGKKITAHLIKTYNGQWSIPPTSSFQALPRLEIG